MSRLHRLAIGLAEFNKGGVPSQPNGFEDIRLEVITNNGRVSQIWSFTTNEKTRYFERQSIEDSGETLGFQMKVDLYNVPPTKSARLEVVALDVNGVIIGNQTIFIGKN